jgi:hypothetical protein
MWPTPSGVRVWAAELSSTEHRTGAASWVSVARTFGPSGQTGNRPGRLVTRDARTNMRPAPGGRGCGSQYRERILAFPREHKPHNRTRQRVAVSVDTRSVGPSGPLLPSSDMVTAEILPDWLGDVDLARAGLLWAAASLLLAFVVFLRDRRNAELAAEVDLVEAWGEGDYELKPPGGGDVVQATIYMHLRNASTLPMVVKQLGYEVHTRWSVEDREQPSKLLRVYKPVDAAEPHRAFVDDVQLAPGETKNVTPYEVNLEHLAPQGSRQLDLVGGVKVQVASLLVIDSAGRRWVVNSHQGGRAKRVRWWRRRSAAFKPATW